MTTPADTAVSGQGIIDTLERDLERMRRAIDPALLATMIARLDELRKAVG
jgi:hypothetical protein